MTELLRATGVRLGLVTNGEHWMLVNAPKGETTGFISWYAQTWLDERITFRAFRSLLSVRRFFGVDEKETLEALLDESMKNPDRFPFLEGRNAGTIWTNEGVESHPLPVDNRTALHLLEALQLLQVKVPGGGPAEARQLSFRSLDIEQIGHVYEGLLDHTAKRTAEPYLGLIGKEDEEPEVPLAELEMMKAKGEADLLGFLKEKTGKTENVLVRLLQNQIDDRLADRFRTACQNDDALWQRVAPFAGLVRMDSFGRPIPEYILVFTANKRRQKRAVLFADFRPAKRR